VIKDVFPKLGTMDFAPFLSAIDIKGADATYTWLAGIDAIRFVQQYQEFGLKKRLPLFGYNVITDGPYLPSIGDAALGIITVGHYSYTLDTPKNRAFVKAYSAKYGERPSRYTMFGYSAAIVNWDSSRSSESRKVVEAGKTLRSGCCLWIRMWIPQTLTRFFGPCPHGVIP
jgi:branched-chain amino acid transport system substrate-binding protein